MRADNGAPFSQSETNRGAFTILGHLRWLSPLLRSVSCYVLYSAMMGVCDEEGAICLSQSQAETRFRSMMSYYGQICIVWRLGFTVLTPLLPFFALFRVVYSSTMEACDKRNADFLTQIQMETRFLNMVSYYGQVCIAWRL